MVSYRCYFLNSGGHIVGLKDLTDCTAESEARRIAITLWNQSPHYAGVSLWHGDRTIFEITAPTDNRIRSPELAA